MPLSPPTNNKSKYTQLCKSIEKGKHCKYGDKCLFSHDVSKLLLDLLIQPYKTNIVCRSVRNGIICKYGSKCKYSHVTQKKKIQKTNMYDPSKFKTPTPTEIKLYGMV